MKNIFLGVLMIGGLFGPPSNPEQAQEKYESEAYLESAGLYINSLEEYPTQRPHLNFNIGQSFLRADSMQRALTFMSQATAVGKMDKKLASLAWNNIGGLHAAAPQQGAAGMPGMPGAQPQAPNPDSQEISPIEQALEDFKNALRNDPDNELARYNYELLKRKMEQQQQQQEQDQEKKDDQQKEDKENEDEKKDQNQDQENKEDQKDQQEQQQQQNQEKENKENKGQNQQQQGEGQEQKMSMEQAKMLLDAMNQNEKKFLQQLQKSKAKRAPRHRGPEW